MHHSFLNCRSYRATLYPMCPNSPMCQADQMHLKFPVFQEVP
jgi:hypothetical protein